MRNVLLAVFAVFSMALASCADEPEEAAESTSGDLQAYCDAVEDATFLPGEPVDDDPEKLKEFNIETKAPAFEDVAATAPDEVKDDIDIQLEDLKEGEGFPSEEARAAHVRTAAFDHENCDWQTVDMTVTEYKIEGVPKTVKAGLTSLRLTNEGKVSHDFGFRRIDGDVEESLAEILEDEDKFFREGKVEGIGGMGAEPGDSGYALLRLEPGRFGMACYETVGSEGGEQREGGEHHFERGELAEFTVE